MSIIKANRHQPDVCLSLATAWLRAMMTSAEQGEKWCQKANTATKRNDGFYKEHERRNNVLNGGIERSVLAALVTQPTPKRSASQLKRGVSELQSPALLINRIEGFLDTGHGDSVEPFFDVIYGVKNIYTNHSVEMLKVNLRRDAGMVVVAEIDGPCFNDIFRAVGRTGPQYVLIYHRCNENLHAVAIATKHSYFWTPWYYYDPNNFCVLSGSGMKDFQICCAPFFVNESYHGIHHAFELRPCPYT